MKVQDEGLPAHRFVGWVDAIEHAFYAALILVYCRFCLPSMASDFSNLAEFADHGFLVFENGPQDLQLILNIFDLFEADDIFCNTEWITSDLRFLVVIFDIVPRGFSVPYLVGELLPESCDLGLINLRYCIVKEAPTGGFLVSLGLVRAYGF